MEDEQRRMIIRPAAEADARAIAEILVEDWQTAYRGIIDDTWLDAMDVEERTQREARRYRLYTVAEDANGVQGFAWNERTDGEADCEIVALYVRYAKRNCGIGRALFLHSMEAFRAAGRKRMIVWCLKDNGEARRFYERMGGKAGRPGTHPWGSREYDMVSYVWQL